MKMSRVKNRELIISAQLIPTQSGYRFASGSLPAFTVNQPENFPIVGTTWGLIGFQRYAGPVKIDQRGRKPDIGVRGMELQWISKARNQTWGSLGVP